MGITVGGRALAGQAIEAGLVDEYHLFLVPVVVGGGKRSLPDNDVRVNPELLDERLFRNGTIHLHYRGGLRTGGNPSAATAPRTCCQARQEGSIPRPHPEAQIRRSDAVAGARGVGCRPGRPVSSRRDDDSRITI
jgi:RibD C-terminal domain